MFCTSHRLRGMVHRMRISCTLHQLKLSTVVLYVHQLGMFCTSHRLRGMVHRMRISCTLHQMKIQSGFSRLVQKILTLNMCHYILSAMCLGKHCLILELQLHGRPDYKVPKQKFLKQLHFFERNQGNRFSESYRKIMTSREVYRELENIWTRPL